MGALLTTCVLLAPVSLAAQQQGQNTSWDVPVSPFAAEVTAIDTFRTIDLKGKEIAVILPLLIDLRDAENTLWADTSIMANRFLSGTASSESSMKPSEAVDKAMNIYRHKRDRIWDTIGKRIGTDKANSLRNLVQPKVEHVDSLAVDDGIRRIDTLIAQWDTASAARIAQYGGTTPPATVTVEKTTIITTTPGRAHVSERFGSAWGDAYMVPAPLKVDDLVRLLRQKLINDYASPQGRRVFWYFNGDLEPQDLNFLWLTRLGYYD